MGEAEKMSIKPIFGLCGWERVGRHGHGGLVLATSAVLSQWAR